jgi:hypothetical protein
MSVTYNSRADVLIFLAVFYKSRTYFVLVNYYYPDQCHKPLVLMLCEFKAIFMGAIFRRMHVVVNATYTGTALNYDLKIFVPLAPPLTFMPLIVELPCDLH